MKMQTMQTDQLNQQQSRQQVNSLLLSKTLQQLNKNSSFIYFKNKILRHKNKRLFDVNRIQQNQTYKKNKRRASNLLISGSNNKFKQTNNSKFNLTQQNQHSIYDSKNKNKVQKYQKEQKRRFKTLGDQVYSHQTKRINYFNTKSITKIQQLVNKQKQQPIEQNKYNSQNYIFLGIKNHLGESRQPSIYTNTNNRTRNQSIDERQSSNNYHIKIRKSHQKNHTLINNHNIKIDTYQENRKQTINTKNWLTKTENHQDQEQIRQKTKSHTKYDRINSNKIKQELLSTDIKQKQSQNFLLDGLTKNIINFGQKQKQSTSNNNFIKLKPIITNIKVIQDKQKSTESRNSNSNRKTPPIALGIKAFLSGLGLNKSISAFQAPSLRNQSNSSQLSKDNERFSQQLQQIRKIYESNNPSQKFLYDILSKISRQVNQDAIRIYKDDFSKIYSYRYGRDKITSFFDYEYIEDYDSLNGMFEEFILNLKKDEVLVISFIMLDFDGDGLINHSDLFKMLLKSDKNQLIKRTAFTILQHVKEKINNNQIIRDKCSQDYLKKQNLTLKKYRFMMYMKQKKKNQQNKNKTISSPQKQLNYSAKKQKQQSYSNQLIIPPIHGKLFTLRSSDYELSKQNQILKILLSALTKNNQSQFFGLNSFSINLTTFKKIYSNKIPQIYYDMLYSAFGFKRKQYQYLVLDYETPLLKPVKIQDIEELSKWDILLNQLMEMKLTKQDLNEKIIKIDLKRQRKIKSTISS